MATIRVTKEQLELLREIVRQDVENLAEENAATGGVSEEAWEDLRDSKRLLKTLGGKRYWEDVKRERALKISKTKKRNRQ